MSVAFATVGRDVGRILQVFSVTAFVSVLVSAVHRELYAIPALLVTGALAFGIGWLLARRFADAPSPGKLHGMLIAATSWFAVSLLGALPFLLVAWTIALDPFPAWANAPPMTETVAAFQRPLDGVFESMSGFTSTGLTMAAVEEDLPATLQWWRSFTEWVGGVGVIVLTVAILARPGSGSLTLYESEARSDKIHPSIVSTVRSIWWIYLLLTGIAIALFAIVGMGPWDAINHGLTGIATGGFSTHADSIAHYDSALIEYAVVPVMVMGSIAFPVHYLVLRGEIRNLYADVQTRWLFGYFAVGTAVLTGVLLARDTYAATTEAVRYGLFQFVSSASCTGFQTAPIGPEWGIGSTLLVCLGMLTGGAAGSTVGGIKLVRVITLVQGTAWRIGDVFYPDSAVRRLHIGDRSLDDAQASQEFEEAAIVAFLWLFFLAVGLAVLLGSLPTDVTLEDVLFEIMSAQGNVGLSTGITGPEMPTAAKAVFVFNMWIGRLEIIPVLVLLRSLVARGGLYR